MHFPKGDQSPDLVFSKCEEASVDEGLVNNTLEGSRLPCDANSVSTYCNQGYRMAITRMCYFFSKISQKMIGKQELSDLHEFMVETQNQLEMCLPPFLYNATSHDSHGSSDTGAGPLLLA